MKNRVFTLDKDGGFTLDLRVSFNSGLADVAAGGALVHEDLQVGSLPLDLLEDWHVHGRMLCRVRTLAEPQQTSINSNVWTDSGLCRFVSTRELAEFWSLRQVPSVWTLHYNKLLDENIA